MVKKPAKKGAGKKKASEKPKEEGTDRKRPGRVK
jgi:hypothetical protein